MEDILNQREKRVMFQEELMKKYNMPLVFLKVNYPGLNKVNNTTKGIIKSAFLDLKKIFMEKIFLNVYEETLEGPNYTALIDCDEHVIKIIAIEFEETHPLGRLIDIDIYSIKNYENISRSYFNLPPRKCYLCSKDAFICMREQNHTNEEIINYINNSFYDYTCGR